jgi:hypothetical protein
LTKRKSIIFLIITLTLTSCSQTQGNNEVKSEKQFVWTDELINTALVDTCVGSSQWRSYNPDEVPLDYRSSSPVGHIDTSSLTDFPTVLIAGVCPHDAGAGYGNEFFFVGFRSELENKVFLIEKILGEDSGLTLENDLIISNNKIVLELNGYSDSNLCAACRDAIDVVEIEIVKNKPVIEYLSSNTYQIKDKINGTNQLDTSINQEQKNSEPSYNSENTWPSEADCLKLYAKDKEILDIKSEIDLLDGLQYQYEYGSPLYNDYKKQADFKKDILAKLESQKFDILTLNDDMPFCTWKWDNPYS